MVMMNSWDDGCSVQPNESAFHYDGMLEEPEQRHLRVWSNSVNPGEGARLQKILLADGFIVGESLDEPENAGVFNTSSQDHLSLLTLQHAPAMTCKPAWGHCFQGLNESIEKNDKRLPGINVELVVAQDAVLGRVAPQVGTAPDVDRLPRGDVRFFEPCTTRRNRGGHK